MGNIEDESFYPWAVPRILLSIHSPFVPVSTLEKGELLRSGHLYSINIRMEEEHFLEYPFYTNCTDYYGLWKKNNKTGPRSKEMCEELCWWKLYKADLNCDKGFKMIQNLKNVCEHISTYFSVLYMKSKAC
ncbi:uncharacterized protein NPIL_291291 [Nephila pilipes]|uniref:Uncharacterized protein n=1 Tax=Nephila pilipes TaxID=299642 RepID=A0A8X6NG11_NEPPI|nr:uncharacterized protein NPIL_291291 [Nephila pilipes]